jgi:hypothetical protein
MSNEVSLVADFSLQNSPNRSYVGSHSPHDPDKVLHRSPTFAFYHALLGLRRTRSIPNGNNRRCKDPSKTGKH